MTVNAINEGYKNLGYAVVTDAVEEWDEVTRTIHRLEVKKKLYKLTETQEAKLTGLRGRKHALEAFLMSDWGESLGNMDGKTLVTLLNERASKW